MSVAAVAFSSVNKATCQARHGSGFCGAPLVYQEDPETHIRSPVSKYCPECRDKIQEARESRILSYESKPCKNPQCDVMKADDGRPYCFGCFHVMSGKWQSEEDCEEPQQWKNATRGCDKCGKRGATLKRPSPNGNSRLGEFNKLCNDCFGAQPRCPGGPATEGCGAFLQVDEKTEEVLHAHCFDCYKNPDNRGSCKVLNEKGVACGKETTLSNTNAGQLQDCCQECFKNGLKCRKPGCFARTQVNHHTGKHFWFCKQHYVKTEGGAGKGAGAKGGVKGKSEGSYKAKTNKAGGGRGRVYSGK
jgi:hypothetical protein